MPTRPTVIGLDHSGRTPSPEGVWRSLWRAVGLKPTRDADEAQIGSDTFAQLDGLKSALPEPLPGVPSLHCGAKAPAKPQLDGPAPQSGSSTGREGLQNPWPPTCGFVGRTAAHTYLRHPEIRLYNSDTHHKSPDKFA